MPTVETRAGTLTYQDHGPDQHQGPVLILLHATLHSHHDFDAIAPTLARDHRVITLDWPGCGDSAPAADPAGLTAPLFADALEDLVDHLDVPKVVVIGNSVGGFAAARLAINRPDQVAGLVLVQTGGFMPMTAVARLFCRVMGTPAIFKVLAPLFIRAYMKPQTALDHEIVNRTRAHERTTAGRLQGAALWRSFAAPDHDLRSRAAGLATPTLIVWGRRDVAIPPAAGRAAHAAISGSQFAMLNTGHVSFASAPDEFLALTQPFLATIREHSTR
ncbi:alpha/beta hydrolase [Mycobacterium sp. CBMA293]|uniref:alpha/beta fold hydrolase n=1 Tax=unclassified Mycolicibacterium TaxID=2636767 RepID=UPI0012DF2369|nr:MULTISPECIES: alpha/beta hydrolase [unclassified Mycolicibacterium]MUL47812.1 alpha/beta hydrolase [Mycolicibacterium sp. CBMA 360]MUL59341.1 alpha/beta hydrolase [Mycolicibacterium sp. CBMA 335]MUL71066.1 alpha/beta hydrolase [Mycolicibacterium sp. CBMA 311]MUL94709.1 alpha/beta hydrolase [Mycolicibacterium sp. CBMA 230]MUM09113.1 alpha/beta hydrolase [Mycolicibacterium sp. CBMA 213]